LRKLLRIGHNVVPNPQWMGNNAGNNTCMHEYSVLFWGNRQAGKTIIKRKDVRMRKSALLSWLLPMAFGLALLIPQSAFSQGCG
jgi:hypothetical protein